ncbi:MAG: hypothetical protein GXP24_03445 [Planctomycetes bacterium]|nr:hypothetical protein [Planctomycetota bacterium]
MLRLLIFGWTVQLAAIAAAGEFAAPRQVDERRAAQVGLRKIVGRHLRLYTDLPPSDAVDSLPAVFDAAVPLWAEYFQVDVGQLRNWRMQGYLIQERAKFAALGLLPKEKPDFATGFSNGNELWLMEQPSDYFRRHLLLHEGTHGFMYTELGDTGAGWYMEGMAELFGTHRWQQGKLDLRVMPSSRQEVPMWGRIKLVREAYRAGTPLDLPQVISLKKRRAFSTSEYAWAWALCQFLDSHPRWQKKFRQLTKHVNEQNFNQRFRHDFQAEWPELLTEWQAFVATLDYGYDAHRMAMQHLPVSPVTDETLTAGKSSVTIAADRGWQSTGWLFEAGQEFRVTAEGRYQIAIGLNADGGPWPCEPGGVTLEYHAGHPLGMLLGAWRSLASNRFSKPITVGLTAKLKPPEDAVLYLRVNDSPARLSDNRGSLDVSIRRITD